MIVAKTTQSTLLSALQSVAGIVERRTTMPVLANVLLRRQGATTELVTSDLEVQLQTTAELGGDEPCRPPAVPGAAEAKNHVLHPVPSLSAVRKNYAIIQRFVELTLSPLSVVCKGEIYPQNKP